MSNTLVAAREALERHQWDEAREAFLAADDEGPLTPADLQHLADAAWWSGHPDEAVQALERAYGGHVEAGDDDSAVIAAFWLTYFAIRRGSMAVASGWMSKAESHVEGKSESAAGAWIHFLRMVVALFMRGQLDEAVAHSDEALSLARKYGVPEIEALSQSFKGYALLTKGDLKEGMALIDQASAAVVSGELDPHAACGVYCNTIACCANVADYRRAGEWTAEAERWMRRHSLGGYPGECRVHRAELKKLHGAYPEAEQEARVACEELERFRLLDAVGYAYYEIGEVRLRMGDLEAAGESFMRAYEYGWHSQPGLALLKLARGDVAGAESDIAASLATEDAGDGTGGNRLERARLLPARVRIALEAGDEDGAARATEELEQIAADYEQPAFEAAAHTARGAVELSAGRAREAVTALERAWRGWREIDLPYESAQARMLLGQARAAAGDDSTARMELVSARAAFERLGAVLDVHKVDELLGEEEITATDTGRRVTKTFMFTDIVTSTDLVEVIGDEAWEDLLRWHDRALRSEFARHRGQEVRQTGDGFFIAFDEAGDAIEAAVGIQRRLAEHRREHGFALRVRIGVHTATATPQGGDYAGQGVHLAARVGDTAEAEEIVASSDTVEAAGTVRYPVTEARTVPLKGITDPVKIHTIAWR